MSLKLENLDDEELRKLMLEELEMDVKKKRLYISPRLKEGSKEKYIELFRDAILNGDDEHLAKNIVENGCLRNEESRNTKNGTVIAKVPSDAHLTLAEGEFNRFYIRALCRKAISKGKIIEVYRAKQVANPRSDSQVQIGKVLDPQKLLEDLRQHIGVDSVLGVPAGPNSGLSVRLKN